MDPITQGALGAIAGQALTQQNKKYSKLIPITLIAGLAGMSPDLDVLIRSNKDPLLFLVYHRQFTHSLFFIPLGALLCCLALHPTIGKRYQLNRWHSYFACMAGYATHALLDACTSYGTLLLWPFSHQRFAWNSIAVIDIAYTLPLLLGIFLSIKYKSSWPARAMMIWAVLYPSLGYMQQLKAEKAAQIHLEKKFSLQSHRPQHTHIKQHSISAKPSMSNIVLWKIIYESNDFFYIDAIKVGLFESVEEARYLPGSAIKKLSISRDLPWLDPNSQQAKDIERFTWFSMGYVAKATANLIKTNSFKDSDAASQIRIIDVRYSIVPNEINPLWSIGLRPNAEITDHASYDSHRDASATVRKKFADMLFGREPQR